MVVQQLRKSYTSKKFDYINAGIPGYWTKFSLKNFKLRVAKHDPDIVVICHATNDLTHFSRIAATKNGISFSTEAERLSWLSEYSQLFYLLEKNYFLWATKNNLGEKTNKLIVPDRVLAEPFQESLEELVRQAQSIARKVVLVTFSTRIRAQQSEQEKKESSVTSLYYMPYIQPGEFVRYFAAYNETIRTVSRHTGTLLIGNEHSIPGTKKYFKDSVHFTDAGSRLMAKRVADGLIEAGTIATLR